jgi:hypothetical protein
MATNYTITLTDKQETTLRRLLETRPNRTKEEMIIQVVERGLYDLTYRTKRNREQYEAFKEFRARKAAL